MGDHLKSLENKFIRAGEFGAHLQKEGVKIVKAAEKGLETIKILKSIKDIDEAAIETWTVGSGDIISAYPPVNVEQQIGKYCLALGTSVTAGMTIFSDLHSKEDFDLTEDELKELDSYLEDFTQVFGALGDFVKMRHGAWEAYYSATDIALMIASHAMREILRKIISQLGSNANLAEAKEASTEGEEKKISNRDRLKFVMFGSGSTHEAGQEMVEMVSNKCFEAFTRLQEVAHGSAGQREEVRAYMRVTEQSLLSILRLWKLRVQEKT